MDPNFSSPTSSTAPSSPTAPIWSPAAHWVLRIAFATRCVALGVKYLWQTFECDSNIFSTLFFEAGLAESTAKRVDDIGMFAMVMAGCIVLLSGFARETSFVGQAMSWFSSLALRFAVAWELLLAGTATYRGGEFMSEWALAEHGLRIATPIALLWMSSSRATWRSAASSVDWLLRLATSMTFAAHGIKAWVAAPAYVTMVIATCQNLFEYWPEQSSVETALKIISAADIAVALLILCRRWPRVALYAAVWGLITATGRVTSSSLGWPEAFLRAVHVGGPLFLYLQWRRSARLLP